MLAIEGSCHCGNIRYRLDWPDNPARPTGRECGCGYCRMHGAVWTGHADARLSVTVAQPADVIDYRCGHRSAAFRVCARCGILTLAVAGGDEDSIAVVNVNTFDSLDPASLATLATDFDGESKPQRAARRRRSWTPVSVGQA